MHNKKELSIRIITDTVTMAYSLFCKKHFNTSEYARKMYCLSRIRLFDSFTVLCVCTSANGEYIDEMFLNCENVLRPYIFSSRIIEYAAEKHGYNILIAAKVDLIENEDYKMKFIDSLKRLRVSLALSGLRFAHLIISDKYNAYFPIDENLYL